MKKWHLAFVSSVVLFASCGVYNKAYKVNDAAYKNEVADQLFLQGKFRKANNLYHQIYELERWNMKYQSAYFNYARSLDTLGKYELLVPFLKSYNMNYISSPFREETMFRLAKGEYNLTDVYSKDQERTYKAIEQFDAYLKEFPNGKYKTEAIQLRTELLKKLEVKAFEAAKLYNKIGEYTRDYNAAIVALNNFILDYPGSSYKEDALYYKFDSAYKLAINSVYHKMEDRIKMALEFHQQLIDFNADTKYKKQAAQMVQRLEKELKQFN